jgi:dTMP kinase
MSKFITVEGTEGVGKTSVISSIRQVFEAHTTPHILTREPGGTPLAEALRGLLLAEREEDVLPDTELLLLYAGRIQHWHNKIKPALAAGTWVVSDRFFDATFAYQGGGRQVPFDRIKQIHKWALDQVEPDHTILLDAPVEVGLARIQGRAHLDRFEHETLAFFNRVRAFYLKLAEGNPRFTIVDATQSEIEIQKRVAEILENLLK